MRLWQSVLGTCTAYLLIFPIWIAYAFGRIRTHWSSEARQVFKQGGVLVIANHPSLVETAVLPALYWRPGWLRGRKRNPWSLADEHLFGKRRWLYESFHCVLVSREMGPAAMQTNLQAVRTTIEYLRSGGIVVLYPEGGRTCKGTTWHCQEDRRVRNCEASLVRSVRKRGFNVIPVWIEHGVVTRPESFAQGYRKLFFGPKFHAHFGQPLSDDVSVLDSKTIAAALLGAGK